MAADNPFGRQHDKDCRFNVASTCAGAVECPHGYDVCPSCDPCTCSGAAQSVAGVEHELQTAPTISDDRRRA